MTTYAGYMQTGMAPAAGVARPRACATSGRPSIAWQLTDAALGTAVKQAITFVDSPDTDHRYRRPWGTS